MRTGAAGVLAAGLLLATPALACPPPPPPPEPLAGEAPAAYQQRLAILQAEERARADTYLAGAQDELWQRAATILVGRVERVVQVKQGFFGGMRKAVLRPVATLKGKLVARSVTVADNGLTSCGAYGGGDATIAQPGDTIALFFKPGAPGPKTLLDAIGHARARDPKVLAALATRD